MIRAYGPLLIVGLAAVVWLVVVTLDLTRRERSYHGVTLWGIFLTVAAAAIVRGVALAGTSGVSELPSQAVRVLQVVTLMIPTAAAIGLVVAARLKPVSAWRSGRSLWLAMLAVAGAALLSAVFGIEPSVRVFALATMPAVVTATYLLPRISVQSAASMIWVSTGVIVGVSLATWIGGWEYALADTFSPRRVPMFGTTQRLQGVLEHPNALGPVAALAFVITVWKRRGWFLVGAPSAVALLATDSLTAIAAVPVALACLWYYSQDRGSRLRGSILLSSFAVAASFVAIAPRGIAATQQLVERFGTFTGRTTGWAYALDRWRESPFVGYGPEVFGDSFRAETGLQWLGQAHNQFLQSLAESGLIGLAALILLVVVAARIALRTAWSTAGLTAAIAALFALRMLTEAPLRGSSPLVVLLVLALVVLLLAGLDEVEGIPERYPSRATEHSSQGVAINGKRPERGDHRDGGAYSGNRAL